MNFKEDPKNLIIPLDLTKIIYSEWDADLAILDQPDQVYGKALHGNGRVTFKNGNQYIGEFHNGMLHGTGKFIWVSGVIYEGEFTYNKIEGQGQYTWPDGSKYIGTVVNGLRHGQGKFFAVDDSAIYDGAWEQGMRHGFGTIRFKSGAIFEGQFVKGNKQGIGKMTYPTGNYYEGAFLLDEKTGQGTMVWVNSNEKYSGAWVSNRQDGWGIHIWIEPKGEGSKYLRNRYEGEWHQGERHGVGVFYYANGAKYVGEWRNNLKCGVAMFLTDSGGVIIGEFKQDRLVKVYGTTENEQRTGILPREIAPTSAQEAAVVSEQMKSQNKITADKPKKQEKLTGINNPNATQSSMNKQMEINPYSYMIDFSDLYRGMVSLDYATMEQNVQTMLLRHNSTLKAWYKFFAEKFNSSGEESFSLSIDGFWKIIRDSKLLNPNYSLASVNRCFLQGCKNDFPLKYSQTELQQQVSVLLKFGTQISLTELDDTFHIDLANQILQNEENIHFAKTTQDVHQPKRCLLFRHFVDLLVRVAYLKYANFNELHRAIERIIIQKLTPYYERKKGKENQSLDDTKKSTVKIVLDEYMDEVKPLYQEWGIQTLKIGYTDTTINLEQIFKLLDANEQEKAHLISLVEKHFDTEEGSLAQQSQSMGDQSSVNQTMKEDTSKRKKKQQESAAKAEVKPNILTYELLLFEFTDILIAHLVKKYKDLHNHASEEFKVKLINHIKKLKNRKPVTYQKAVQVRQQPITKKDQQKEQLKQLRIQQALKAKLKKELEAERKREELERNLMGIEDQRILSENDDEEVESEESDY